MPKLLRRHALFRIQRGDAIPDLAPRGEVTFRPVSRENLADVLTFRTQEYADVFERQLAKGQLGVYAYRDGKAVAHVWLIVNRSDGPVRANSYFRLRPRESLVHFASVAEPHRGLGIFQAMLCDLYRRAFASEPVETIYIDTELVNVASRKGIEKTARFVGNAYYLNVFSRGVRLPWY